MKSINLAHIKEDFENPILGFFGEHRWLSNFWSAKIILDEIEFPTAEHAYVYSKGFFSEEQLKTLLALLMLSVGMLMGYDTFFRDKTVSDMGN